jgi:rubredoxin
MAQKYPQTGHVYIYAPNVDDPSSGVKLGTPFEELPADWVYPSCGATKDQFEKVK